MTAKTLPERLRHYTADTQLADNYCEDMHAAADEIERLRAALAQANSQAEHFEREWYLRGDELERLRMDLENTRAEAVLAVATERERCAKVAESRPLLGGMDEWDSTASAIRGA